MAFQEETNPSHTTAATMPYTVLRFQKNAFSNKCNKVHLNTPPQPPCHIKNARQLFEFWWHQRVKHIGAHPRSFLKVASYFVVIVSDFLSVFPHILLFLFHISSYFVVFVLDFLIFHCFCFRFPFNISSYLIVFVSDFLSVFPHILLFLFQISFQYFLTDRSRY